MLQEIQRSNKEYIHAKLFSKEDLEEIQKE